MTQRLTLSTDGDERISITVDCVTDVSETFLKRVTTIPIVTKGSDATFPLETGSGMAVTFSFSRENPVDHDDTSNDPSRWSNAFWYDKFIRLIDRWQLRTDGVLIQYNSFILAESVGDVLTTDYNPYTIQVNERGYIKRATFSYTSALNTIIKGSLDISIGTAYISTTKETPTLETDIVSIVLNPGDLSERLVRTSQSASSTPLSQIYPLFSTSKVKLDLPLKAYIEEEVTTVVFTFPNAPTLWASMAKDAYNKLIGWSYGDKEYTPGMPTYITIPHDSTTSTPIELTAVWGEM